MEENDDYSNNKLQHHWYRTRNKDYVTTQLGRPTYYDEKSFYYILDRRSNISFSIRFFYDPQKRVKNLTNTLIQLNFYDSLKIYNIVYYGVIHLYNSGQGVDDLIRHEYYARNVGIIKRIDKDGVVWNLESYYHSN